MNTLFPRTDDAVRITTDHPPTPPEFVGRPTRFERLQLRVGLWLIRRASAQPVARSRRDPWAEHLRSQRVEAERERRIADAHFITNRLR